MIRLYTEYRDNITYHLSFDGNITNELSSTDNDTSIASALNTLQSIQNIGSVVIKRNLSSNEVIELTVIFVSLQNNLSLIKIVNYTNATSDVLHELWQPTIFSLSFGARKTNMLSVFVPASNLSLEITKLFTTVCQVTGAGNIFFKDSYDVSIHRISSYGTLDSSREPFCGRYSLKNPTTIWRQSYSRDERTNKVLTDIMTVSNFEYKYVSLAISNENISQRNFLTFYPIETLVYIQLVVHTIISRCVLPLLVLFLVPDYMYLFVLIQKMSFTTFH